MSHLHNAAGGRLAILAAVFIGQRLLASAIDFDGSSYARNTSLHADLDIFWTIDNEAETIRVAVHAKAATGWAGVGISEMGGMEGADMVFYEAETGRVTDAHSLVVGAPVTDECSQDWTLLSAGVDSEGLVFEAERALDTGDTQDRVLVDDSTDGVTPTKLIAAWGDSATVSYHGAQSAKVDVVMFGGEESLNIDPLRQLKSTPGVYFFDVTAFHIVGIEGLIQSETSEYVHHLNLRGVSGVDDCTPCAEYYNALTAAAVARSFNDLPEMPSVCSRMEYADILGLGPGVDGFATPEEAGFLVGNSSGGFTSMIVNTHYNNPNGDTGLFDNSGARVYYTTELRAMDMGTVLLGDPSLSLMGTPIPDGKTSFVFGCPGFCTEEYFEVENVTLFSHTLHMHETGQRLRTRHYRNDSGGNEVMIHSAEVEYFSFEQASAHTVYTDGTVTIQRGDRFETECFYDTALSSVGSENVSFGFGSENEMCVDTVAYYPKQNIPRAFCGHLACGGALLGAVELPADSDFNRTFGVAAASCATDENVIASSSSSRVTLAGLASSAGVAALWFIVVPLMLGTFLV